MAGGYQRLSYLDRCFLAFESSAGHMHVAGAATFRAGPLRRPDGGLDIARMRSFVGSRLPRIPRYRQIVADTLLAGPIWIDDPHFNLEYHVRHTSLPLPGDETQFKQLCGRVFSQALDRAKPLWELWFVEGVAGGDRFGFISKVHHAMVDGISSVDLLEVLLSHQPITDFEPAPPWLPRPAPSRWELARDQLRRLVPGPSVLTRAPALFRELREPGSDLRATLRGLTDLAFKTARRPSETPLNQPIGPHRRFDWLLLDLGEVKAVRRALGGSVNDVVLATVTGGVRRFLAHRGVSCDGLEFRVMAPVSIRTTDERGTLGNRVSAWMVPLPIAEADPRRRLALLQDTTARLKQEKNALGAELLTRMSGWTPATLLSLGARLAWRNLPFNMVVTNVPGPQQPLYLLGAEMFDHYGMVPITDYLGLGIVIFSYAGKISFGFNADWDLLPDLDVFARSVAAAFDELRELAAAAASGKVRA